MTIYLGLGTNDGDRKENLERAIDRLIKAGFRLQKVSPVVESPALLPPDADPAWHKPYLNLAISGDADWQPHEGLAIAKQIERQLGRKPCARWSPRPIDIDLLYWHDYKADHKTDAGQLTLPHADACRRDFVLTPLLHLQPDLPLGASGKGGANGQNDITAFQLTQTIRPIPLWMAIINLTPDSFSDGGDWANAAELDAYLAELIACNVHIIDVGAESTRPGATLGNQALSPAEEWARLEPTLANLAEKLQGQRVKPWLSVDSRNPATIEKALRYGVEIINDVTGLTDPEMMALAKQNDCQVIAMHSLTVPVDPAVMLPDDRCAVGQIIQWREEKMEAWACAGLNLNRIILDPGIGFGKSTVQTFDILSRCSELRQSGLRLLIGHSRKSFMNGMTPYPPAMRDFETLGMSLSLCQQGVDIIRVHAPIIHMRANLARAHIA